MRLGGANGFAGCGLALALGAGCGDSRECPPEWTTDDPYECTPPDAHAADVASRIETGFYGYASNQYYVDTDENEQVECEARELARNTVFTVLVGEPNGAAMPPLLIETDENGLFEFPADPLLEYVLPGVGGMRVFDGDIKLVAVQISIDC